MEQVIKNEVNSFLSYKNTFGVGLSKNEIYSELKYDYNNSKDIFREVVARLEKINYFRV